MHQDLIGGGILKARSNTEFDSNNQPIEHICIYASGTFRAAELNYHSNEKKLLAIIRMIKKFSIYLTPVKFLVRTDNTNVTYFRRTKISGDNKQGRPVRWQNWLSRYDFNIQYLEGSNNIFADFLTREVSGNYA